MLAFEAEDLIIRREGEVLLDRQSFFVESGTMVGIAGDDQVTRALVEVILGLEKPAHGRFRINGEVYQPSGIQNAERNGIGYVLAAPRLMDSLTIAENIYFGGKLNFFVNRKEINATVQKFFDEIELDLDPGLPVAKLTANEKFLADLARALYHRPKLILTEQVWGLNRNTLDLTRKLAENAMKQGGAFLFLTDSVNQVVNLVDYAAVIRQGVVGEFFKTEKAKQNPVILGHLLMGESHIAPHQRANTDEVYKVMLKTTDLLATEFELNDLLDYLAEGILDVSGAAYCRILVKELENAAPTEKFLRYRAGKSVVRMDENLAAAAMKLGVACRTTAACGEVQTMDLENGAVPCLGLALPIKIRSQCLGAIQLGFSYNTLLTKEFTHRLDPFVKEVAIAVENNRLLVQSTMVREAHHRIKNNLQSIVSLLNMQTCSISNAETREVIDAVVSRVKAIAVVHELLVKDEASNEMVNLKEMLIMLLRNFSSQIQAAGIHLETDMEDCTIRYHEATSVLLVVNELLSNCLKHAFTAVPELCCIRVCLQNDGEMICITVADSGKGYPPEFDSGGASGFGTNIICSLVRNALNGTIRFCNGGLLGGAQAELTFGKTPHVNGGE